MNERDSTAAIRGLQAAAYRIPTDGPEADGTFAWDATTMVVVHAQAGGQEGMGYTYADACITSLIASTAALFHNRSPDDDPGIRARSGDSGRCYVGDVARRSLGEHDK